MVYCQTTKRQLVINTLWTVRSVFPSSECLSTDHDMSVYKKFETTDSCCTELLYKHTNLKTCLSLFVQYI